MNPRYHLPVLVGLSILLFVINLGGYDLWPPDEPRFAQVAREMLQSGDYLVPRMNGQPYTEKPPLLFWMAAAFSLPVGDVTEFTARLPLALGGIATVILTYLLAGRLFDSRIAFWSALILITNQRIWWQARFGQIDMLLTAFVTAAILCFWQWHHTRQQRWLIGLYLSMAASLLTKGPPGIVFPIFLAIAFFWGRKEQRKGLHLVAGTVVALLITAAWMIPARMAITVESGVAASDGIASNLFRQTIGRFFLGISHAQWPWFYGTHLPLDLVPWSIFLPWTLYWVWTRRKESEQMRFLLCWIVPAFIFFSICIGKRSVYLLPLYPPMAILIARSVLDLVEGDRVLWRRRTSAVWGVALLIIALAPLALPFTKYAESWHLSLLSLSVAAGACGMQALYTAVRTDGRSLVRDMAVHFSVVALLCSIFLFPAVDPYKSARSFCAPLRSLADSEIEFNLYSLGFSKEEYVYYARHFHEPILCDLLDIAEMKDLPDYEQARTQSKLKRAIQKAVKEVPVASLKQVTDEEVKKLQEAVEGALDSDEEQKHYLPSYEKAIGVHLDRLCEGMASPRPAFIMVLEEDWRWILALKPDIRSLTVLDATNVGSRSVLLLANEAGAATVGAQPQLARAMESKQP
ncbi:MAG: glycosyltransferase family 39 protein [Candidatus Hydrogenedentes bacterium]|nr:glycosyltransferase family 39 protein [Candidatus Hydrogenedentota bacterium]